MQALSYYCEVMEYSGKGRHILTYPQYFFLISVEAEENCSCSNKAISVNFVVSLSTQGYLNFFPGK